MKRSHRLYLVLVLILALLLSGCGGKNNTVSPESSAESSVESAPQDTPVRSSVTRKDMEDALVQVAFAYYLKGVKIQYDSAELNILPENKSVGISKAFEGFWRTHLYSTLEDATFDHTVYTVCSDYCYSVYDDAFGYPLFGHRLNAVTSCMQLFSEYPEDMVLIRWSPSGDLPASAAKFGATDKHSVSTEQARAFLADWQTNLRPGDVICFSRSSGGHAMLYVGNGNILDSMGEKYDPATGTDLVEPNGSVNLLHKLEEMYLTGTDSYAGQKYKISDDADKTLQVVVFRPLDVLCVDDGDGDPGNDPLNEGYEFVKSESINYPADMKTSGYGITEAARSRMAYPGIEIDRSADVGFFGTLTEGGEHSYTVVVSNKSDDKVYQNYMTEVSGTPFTGSSYTGLTVTEALPEGVEFVSAAGGGVLKDGVISWTLDLAPGEQASCSYTVRVTAARGSLVTNGGGFVDKIPSNVLTNEVGGKALGKEAKDKLAEFAAAGVEKWNSELYRISVRDTDIQMANKLYQSVLGLKLELPDLQTLLDSLFRNENIMRPVGSGYALNKSKAITAYMYTEKQDIAEEYRLFRSMLVKGYLGGLSLWTDVTDNEKRTYDLNSRHLQPGDILVQLKLEFYKSRGGIREVQPESAVLVYLGNGSFAMMTGDGRLTRADSDSQLIKSFAYDVFFLLRPSQAYGDIEAELKADMALSFDPAVDKLPEKEAFVLTEEQKQAFAAIDGAAVNTGNMAYISAMYSAVGVDVSSVISNASYSNAMSKALFNLADGRYVLPATAPGGFDRLRAALLDGFMGGRLMAEQKQPKLTDLEIGDAVCTGIVDGEYANMDYTTLVYQGDGRFAVNVNYREVAGGTILKRFETWNFTEEGFAEFLQDTRYTGYFVLRPLQALD